MRPSSPAAMVPCAERSAFLADALAGLAEHPKRLPGKYLWDEAGSILFDRICGSADYYPTQCEMALLPRVARAIADRVGRHATIVEFGSGASRKVRVLLDTLHAPARYVALDISRDYLQASLDRLAPDYPSVAMIPVCADYSQPVRLPDLPADGEILGFFPGTSIGNIAPAEAHAFLARARQTLGRGRFLVAVDSTQDEERLGAAYGGCDGLMEAFHLNLLHRLHHELAADIPLDAFRHRVVVAHDPFRVEAQLVAQRAHTWPLGGREVRFAAGESVCTDTSHKYAPEAFRALAQGAGWTPEESWVDSFGFALHLLAV